MSSTGAMTVKLWGVRGSVPSPMRPESLRRKQAALVERIARDGGTERLFGASPPDPAKVAAYLDGLPPSVGGAYGGDTTCIEVRAKGSPLMVLDAGTGIRALGLSLVERLRRGESFNPLGGRDGEREIHIFFTHYHWDHLQGFPFFAPGFIPGPMRVTIHFYGKRDMRKRLSDVLEGQQEYPNFPVVWEDMPCGKEYHELGRFSSNPLRIGSADVTYRELTHPDSVFAYAFSSGGRTFVCATDTEHRDVPDPRLVALARGADLLYYDAQYTPEEYRGEPGSVTGDFPKYDWGHSTYEWAVRSALAAGVERVILGHHDPARDDFGVEALRDRAAAFAGEQLALPENAGKTLEVIAAAQGLEIDL